MKPIDNLHYLYGLTRFGVKTSLDNIRLLCELLGNPMYSYPVVHIAGTNGKGMTAALIHKVLVSSGYKVGLYTSPHLRDFGERIRVEDEQLSLEEASAYIDELKPLFNRVESTFFESTTAMAFLHFARREVDIAVVETGLGGSWDATNIVKPLVCVFTPISLDHTDRLGSDTVTIAYDKSGIIKQGAEVVSSMQEQAVVDMLRLRSTEMDCQFHYAPDEVGKIFGNSNEYGSEIKIDSIAFPGLNGVYRIPIPGRHQWINIQTALSALEVLVRRGFGEAERGIRKGLEEVRWGGRLQVMQRKPLVYYDVAHNPAAASVVAEFFSEHFQGIRVRVILGIVADKDIAGVMQQLARVAKDFTFTKLPDDRSANPELLAQIASGRKLRCRIIPDVKSAIGTVLNECEEKEIVLITGSHYLGVPVLDFFS